MIDWIITQPVIEPALFLLCTGLIIASLEDLVRNQLFAWNGLLSWEVLKYANLRTMNGPVWKVIGRFQSHRSFRLLFVLRMLIAFAILVLLLNGTRQPEILLPLVLLLLLIHLFISMRALFGLDGAHQMNLILLLGITFFYMTTPGSFAMECCILFIGGQAVASYVISGIYKIMGKKWRNGTAMSGIMSARIYGHPWLGAYLRHRPVLCKILCWKIILIETAFIVVPFAPPMVVYIFLGCGIFFHLLNAIFMGLNGFFFAFVATYSSVIYLNHYIRDLLF